MWFFGKSASLSYAMLLGHHSRRIKSILAMRLHVRRSTVLLLATFLLPSFALAQSFGDRVSGKEAIERLVRSAPKGDAANNIVHFSPDGTQITIMSREGKIVIWDVAARTPVQTMPGQVRYTYEATWSPDGSMIASTSVDGTIHLWDVASGQRLAVLDQFSEGSPTMGGGITEARFSPDGRYLAVLQRYSPGRVAVWDLQAETEVVRLERDGQIYGMAWRDDGQRLYTGEDNGSVYAWAFPDGTELREWKLQEGNLFDIDVSDSRIAAGGSGGVLHLVDLSSDASPQRFKQGRFVNRTAVIPNSPYVAAVSSEGWLKVWNGASGDLHFERFAHNANTYSVTVSPDHTTLATVGQDAYVRFWDVETGDLIGSVGSLQPN